MTYGPSFRLILGDSTNIQLMARDMIGGLLPALYAKLCQTDPQASLYLFDKIPSIDRYYATSEVAGFLLGIAASYCAKAGDSVKAMDYYALSYQKLEDLIAKLDLGPPQDELPRWKVARFSAFAKWSEARLAYSKRDFPRVVDCFMKARTRARSDSALAAILERDMHRVGINPVLLDSIEQDLRAPGGRNPKH